jgi:cell shape-determining protein MreC
VLASRLPLIDVGQPQVLQPEDTVLCGRTVLGKVHTVGRWTSTFLPITDAEYRGRAQLVRETPAGPAWHAAGMLRGDGRQCQLDGVSVEESVRVGDLVYTAERDGVLPEPMYYGRVTAVASEPDGRAWRITVAPAMTRPLTTVTIVRAALNPGRFWAH